VASKKAAHMDTDAPFRLAKNLHPPSNYFFVARDYFVVVVAARP
jgi:hypothetical protein